MSDGLTDTYRASKMPMQLYRYPVHWTSYQCGRCAHEFMISSESPSLKDYTPHWCPMCGTRYNDDGVEVKHEK